jgi:hypothetical protein
MASVSIASDVFDFDFQLETLIRNIWNYIYCFTDSPPMLYDSKIVLAVLRKAAAILEKEPVVLDLTVRNMNSLHIILCLESCLRCRRHSRTRRYSYKSIQHIRFASEKHVSFSRQLRWSRIWTARNSILTIGS